MIYRLLSLRHLFTDKTLYLKPGTFKTFFRVQVEVKEIWPICLTIPRVPSGKVTCVGSGKVVLDMNKVKSKVTWSEAPVSIIQQLLLLFVTAQQIPK